LTLPSNLGLRAYPYFWVTVLDEGGRSIPVATTMEDYSAGAAQEDIVRVLSFEYTDSERKADSLKLRVDNYNLKNFDDPVWKKGNRLNVSWGYAGRMAAARQLVITKVTGFTELQIEAKALSLLMNRVTNNQIFENAKRSDVVRFIAEANGWETLDIEDTQVVHPHITQARLTDAQFVRRLAAAEGFQFYVDFEGFHFHRRRTGQRPCRVFRYFTDRKGEIISISIENDLTVKPGGVRVKGRNARDGCDTSGEATAGEPNSVPSLTPTADVGGADPAAMEAAAADALTELTNPSPAAQANAPTQATVYEVMENGMWRVMDPLLPFETTNQSVIGNPNLNSMTQQSVTKPTSSNSAEQARREALALQRRNQETAVKMKLEAVGDPEMYAKTVIQLEGVGRRLGIKYYVKEVVHKIDSGGYTISLDCISDGSGGHSTTSRSAVGLELLEPGIPNTGTTNTTPAMDPCRDTNADGSPLAETRRNPANVTRPAPPPQTLTSTAQQTARQDEDAVTAFRPATGQESVPTQSVPRGNCVTPHSTAFEPWPDVTQSDFYDP